MTENSHIFHIMSFTCVLNINQFNCEQKPICYILKEIIKIPFKCLSELLLILYLYAYINQFYCKNPDKNQEQKRKL